MKISNSVTNIGSSAFYFCTSLLCVTIPNGVTSISASTFNYCTSLTSVSIPKGVTSIGSSAFYNCTSLTSVSIPNGVTGIGNSAFYNCKNLTSMEIPDSVTSIGSSAFYNCESLKSINLPNGLTSIEVNTFNGCSGLTTVELPDGMTKIAYQAFANCSGLKYVVIPNTVSSIGVGYWAQMIGNPFPLSTILVVDEGSYAHSFAVDNDLLFEINTGETLPEIFDVDGVRYYVQNEEAIAISVIDKNLIKAEIQAEVNGYPVVEIRETFKNCTELTEVYLPQSVSVIGDNAFYNCISLDKLSIPSSVSTIGKYAFYGCSNLTNVDLPNCVTEMGDYAFAGCTGMTNIVISNKITKISTYSFNNCTSLQSVEIPNSVMEIGSGAFLGCKNLTSINLPNSITLIGTSAFHNCHSLSDIVIPNTVKSIGYSTFKNCYNLAQIDLCNIEEIGNYAFENCKALVNLEIPNSVTSIAINAFYGCESLTSVVIPEGVVSIGSRCFEKCENLKYAVLPETLSSFYTSSFPLITILLVMEDSYAHTFAIDNSLMYEIYVEGILPEIYDVEGIRYHIQDGKAIAIGVCDTDLTSITVQSNVNGYPVTELRSTFKDCSSLIDVTLPNTLTVIGEYAFYNCSNLTNISIPSSVKVIGDYSFTSCKKIVEFNLPNSLTDIGTYAFAECNMLQSVEIPNSVTFIGERAFQSCSNLSYILLSNSLTDIKECTFASCSGLTSIIIPQGVTKIAYAAFADCTNLTSVYIPKGVTTIGTRAFDGCTSLINVVLPNSMTEIYYWTFEDCINLKYAVIPNSVTSIKTDSFPTSTILLVEENSYAHTFAVDNNLLYFVVHKVENPEISYGVGIEGIVTNSDGTNASGVTVEIYYEDGTLKESVTTDENGAYAFTYAEVGSYTIKAYNSDGNTASTSVAVKRMNVFDVFLMGDASITLKNSFVVSGTVSENVASVEITDLEGNVISALDTENGAFTFTNVPNGTYLVTAKTENGFATKEITVYNSNVTDISLEIITNTASIWGYVEVEDRKYEKHRHHWVTVSVYNEEGNVIATQKSDKDGKYSFDNLPLGDYSIVAKVSEMRPDKKHGYDRSYDLYGYAYVSLTEGGIFEVETIVLYEENDYTTDVSGKVNVNKDKSASCEIIMYNAFGVEYAKIDSENGRYTFKNVKDGLYVIIALTENDGMGYTVITVRNGKVHGNTNINIVKSDKIKDREDSFGKDIPNLEDDSEIETYRARIADEKRFYDSLSQKEKQQLSKEYVNRLNKYIEWLSKCDYTSKDGTKVENGGLVVSGDELEKGDEISFTITVEKQEKWEENTTGVETDKDFIHHNMKDKAGDSEIVQYYEISMTKTSNGSDKVITSVYKDTDAMGKFRITLDIPEEYRGMKHYSLVHVHCGEVTVLTDLDNDPDTITVEIDKFSTFALATTDAELVDEAESTVTIDDIIKFKGYSVGPNGTSMCTGFDIDYEALEIYEAKTGKTIDFGVVFASYDDLGEDKAPLVSATGEAVSLESSAVIKSSLKGYSYTTFDLILTDITNEYADYSFAISAYIYDGESVCYTQGNGITESVTGKSLNEIIKGEAQ